MRATALNRRAVLISSENRHISTLIFHCIPLYILFSSAASSEYFFFELMIHNLFIYLNPTSDS